MATRLPKPGGDTGDWGGILNSFLEVAHNSDGSLKAGALHSAGAITSINGKTTTSGSVSLAASDVSAIATTAVGAANGVAGLGSNSLVPSAQLGAGSATTNSFLRGDGTWGIPNDNGSLANDSDVAISSPATNQVLTYNASSNKWINAAAQMPSNATTSAPGLMQLAGDLGGSNATSPQVVSTHLAVPLPINQGGTGSGTQNFVDLSTSQSIGGTKSFTGEITVPTPTNSTDAATKAYVDATSEGLDPKQSVAAATTGALPTYTYNNGGGGVGATLTATSNAALTIDGYSVQTNDRVLVKDETGSPNNAYNGIYVVTNTGSAGAPYVLTRSTDFDLSSQVPGAYTFIELGSTNDGAGFVCTTTGSVTFGTTAIAWTQFSGAGAIAAGTGLTKSGNTLSLTTPVPINLGGTGSTTQNFVSLAGDLGNTVASPKVESIQGVAISGTPSSGQVLTASGTSAAAWSTLPTAPVTSVNGNTGAVSIAAGYTLVVAASNASTKVKNGADYVCSGTNDHTTINTAISALPGNGGTILLSAGTFSISNSVSITSSNITLEGQGVATELSVPNGTNITYVVSVTGTGTVEVKLRKFFIQGSFGDTFGDGIYIDTPWQSTDTQHTLEDLYITNCPNNAIHVPANADTRVMLFYRIHVKNCKGNGFLFEFPSVTDSVFTDCIADTIGLNGFFIGGANNWFTNCKTFYCGNTGGNNHGFYITGYNNYFEGSQAQDNYQSGFYGDNTGDATYGSFGCIFVNCSADSNGQNGGSTYAKGLQGVGVQNWQVVGGIWFNRPYPPAWQQKYGISWEDSSVSGRAGTNPSTGNSITGAFFKNNSSGPINDTSSGSNYTSSNTYASGTATSSLQGKLMVPSFQVKTGAVSGYVLTSDASGNATWQAGGGGGGGSSPVDWISAVNSYGADPTGTSDSTTAINNALTAAASGATVYLATGTYKTSASLVIPQGVTLMGANGGYAIPIGNYGISGLPITGSIIKPTGTFTGSCVISLTTSSSTQSGQQQIRQISIDASSLGGSQTVHGIQATDAIAGVKMRDVLVYGGSGKLLTYGLYTTTTNKPADFWDVSNCKFSACGSHGVNISGVADCYFFACESTGNVGDAWNITNGNNSRFVGCKGEGSTGSHGWYLTNASGFTGQLEFTNCTTHQNQLDGWALTGSGTGVYMFTGCAANGDGINGTNYGVNIDASFAGTAIFTGLSIVPSATTPVTGFNIASVGGGAQIMVSNSLLWGVTHAVTNDGSAGNFLTGANTIYRTGALTTPTTAAQPLNVPAATAGTATLNGTSAVAVSASTVSSSTLVMLTTQSPAGTLGTPYVSSTTAGTGFSIKSTSSGDTSTVAWMLVNN